MALRERLCECSFWAKYCLFGINFFVWVGGACLLIIGVWARLEKVKLGSLDNLVTDPAFFLIILGTVMLTISIFGCVGSLRENVCFLKIFCIVIGVVFLAEVVAALLAIVFMGKVEEHLVRFMRTAIETYQDDIDLRNAIDYIQRTFRCCGASSYNDWDLNIYYNCSSPARSHCGAPISCCRVPTNIQCGFQARNQQAGFATLVIHSSGCINKLMTFFKDNLVIVGIIAFAVGFVELIAILFAHILIRHIIAVRKEYMECDAIHTDIYRRYNSTDASPP